ncbi:MAG TPA: MotA/TolQ/ExbB proton channel family protein [Clostridia bacterium]|nr:MotA/TolQ/ExbB proton channel family protein [Clostridia bacterium]
MDIATIGGIVIGMALVVWGILTNSSIGAYIDAASIIIVIGGGTAAFFVSYPLAKALSIGNVLKKAINMNEYGADSIIKQIIELANVARREGLLALEDATGDINDQFLQKGIMLIVDGTDPELVQNILESEISNVEDRHGIGSGMFEALGANFPAFGMIGTLIGLVGMLQSLDDPTTIGPKMAVALLTTFYGSLFANLIFIPIAEKLKYKSSQEVLVRNIMLEGLLSIQAGENPRIIEEKLKSFLAPSVRKKMEAAGEQ